MSGTARPARRRQSATGAAASGSSPNNNYIYRDERGEQLFQVVRGRGKRFHIQRFEDGKWITGLGNVKRVLYNMPAVVDAATNHHSIWIVEGEKDANQLIERGYPATTNPSGAGKWRDEYSFALMGVRRAHIIWDNDPVDKKTGKYPGQHHALQIEASLRAHGIPYRFYRAKEGNDLSDHFEAGYSIEELVRERPGPPLSSADTNGHAIEPEDVDEDRPLPAVFQLALLKLRDYAERNNLPQPRKSEKGYEVCCPAHDDHRPSLGISVGNTQPLVVNCQRGCTLHEIAEALDIDIREFGTRQPDHDAETERALVRLRSQNNARIILAGETAPQVEFPMGDARKYMSEPAPQFPFTVEDLHITGSNTLVVSQYKVGKTTLMINLFRSLINVEPFLGHFDVWELPGKVAYLDYEMQRHQFQTWLQTSGGLNFDRMVEPWHLRGQSLHFWSPRIRATFVEWLVENDVKALIIDTAARAWSGLVENENDNTQILQFTDTLDSIKNEAGVIDLFLVAHMGRNARYFQDGEEQSRGATRLEDWMDTGWYYTKDDTGQRYLRAIGRGVDMDSFALTYEAHARRLLTSGVSKKEFVNQTGLQQVVDIIARFDGPPSMSEIKDLMVGGDSSLKHSWVLEAETRGFITRRRSQGRTMRCGLTEQGRKLHERKIQLPAMKATSDNGGPDEEGVHSGADFQPGTTAGG